VDSIRINPKKRGVALGKSGSFKERPQKGQDSPALFILEFFI
jgi:hypothetical protein